MCVGIDFCSEKNCLEQERCVLYEPKHKIPCEVRRGPKKKQQIKIITKNACQIDKNCCTNERACEILGQCILDHPLVKQSKCATKAFKHKAHINQIVFIISILMPSLQGMSYYRRIKKKQKKVNKIYVKGR